MARTRVKPPQMSNPYKARAHKNADQSIADATWTGVTWPVEDYDDNNNFASNTYTAPVSGYYRIGMAMQFITTGHGVSYQVQLLKNGTTFWLQYNQPYPAVTTYASVGFSYNDLIFLNAGDTLSWQAYTDTADSSATTLSGTNGSCFCTFEYAYPA